MEWSVGEGTGRYTASVSDSEGFLSLSSLNLDGLAVNSPDVSISRANQHGRLRVEIAGTLHLAHVAKLGDDWWIHLDGRIHVVRMHEPGSSEDKSVEGGLSAPMPGTILEILVKQGQRVREGQALVVMEAMKMEHRIQAPLAGEITKLHYSVGDRVEMGATLVEIGD
ncbi:MAG: biotin/lipoyl-binding protein [Candidatus Poseidoniales archaeon]|jgi:3-methylcrotonyl-CoA carboxylase alpha subunit|nr:biotin/lipoyl-binding protein [Candidatus Poseidoniales archaeon]